MGFFTAIKRFFIYLGLMAEKASETDAINQAVVERGIRDQKAKADKAVFANGQLNANLLSLKEQVRIQENKERELKYMLDHYAKVNDDVNGATCAEELSNLQNDLNVNRQQLEQVQQLYQSNTDIIAESLRQLQKFQRDFEQTKTQVAISRQMSGVAELLKASITELNGSLGGEMSSAMERMRSAATQGQGQVNATMDVAKAMGATFKANQEARKAKGAALFAEYKARAMGSVQAPVADAQAAAPEKQKVAVPAA